MARAVRTLRTLPPVHPNLGLQAIYRKKLERLIDQMHDSLIYWIGARFHATPPVMASDLDIFAGLSPALAMRKAMRILARRWNRNFDRGAQEIAAWFAQASADRSDKQLATILRHAGMSVRFTMSAAARDVLQATTGANVALIKSIAAQHLSEVEGLVMRSVTEGRNLGYLATQIEARYGLTKRRAALVARDQNNKATATLQRVRQQGLGITHAVWVHSRAGAHPRPEHVAFSGQQYEIDKGAFLEGEWVWPGTAINCRCVCRPVLPF